MPRVSEAQVAEFLRRRPLPSLPAATTVREMAPDGVSQRFYVLAGNTPLILKRYEPSAVESARREVAGLRLAGNIGLAPGLVLADEAVAALGGAVLVYEAPGGSALPAGRVQDDDLRGLLFLLLTLHHLPAGQVSVSSSMSPDGRVWWQRTQKAWDEVRSLFTAPQHQALLAALTRLHAIVGARVESNRELWANAARRPCHGNPVPANVVRTQRGLMLVEWEGFGLGDPAMEVGRVAALGLVSGALDRQQYDRFLAGYAEGTRDLADGALDQRMRIFSSVVPLGYCFTLLVLLARERAAPPADRTEWIDQIHRALSVTREQLGIAVPDPAQLLAPLRHPA
ncbi:MAG TPA: phosphotransferase [Ktedonobacterales bacterium]|nr:phosphotransferase [Ktedonobacterales bacterium]